MEKGYGILPNPKLNEEQANYYHLMDPYTCAWALPANARDIEMSDILMEYWAYCSDDLVDAFYERTLKHKRFDSPDDAEMLDIVRSTIRYEISMVLNLGIAGVIDKAYSTGNLMSAYATSSKVIEKTLKKLLSKLPENS